MKSPELFSHIESETDKTIQCMILFIISRRTIVINLQPNIHNRQHQCSQAGSLSLRGNLGNEVVVNAAHKILKYKKPVLFCTNQQTGSAATLQNNNNKT